MRYVVLNPDNSISQVSEALGETDTLEEIRARVEGEGLRLIEVDEDVNPSCIYNVETGEFDPPA